MDGSCTPNVKNSKLSVSHLLQQILQLKLNVSAFVLSDSYDTNSEVLKTMAININRVLTRLSYLRGRRITLTEFAKMCGLSRTVISRAANSTSTAYTSRTMERILTAAISEIRRHIDADRLPDDVLKKSLIAEMISSDHLLRFRTKRQANGEAKRRLESLQVFPAYPGANTEDKNED